MNDDIKTKRSLLSRVMLFSKNHPVLVFLALSGCFLLLPGITFAIENNLFESGVSWTLYGIFSFFSLFVSLAATLFLWVIDANVFSKLMDHEAIYTVWLTVRDFCNIFFILVLLFSAFATIFQIERYEWKKTLPMLIIMALLVNFSFPIARFVIDLANVPMYFFAQNAFGGVSKEMVEDILGASKIGEIILPGITSASQASSAPVPQMLAATVCMFLFGVSFLVLAVLMLVRMIALAILVMFSPIGFVGMITPALHKFAHDWWDKLFKWAFYGPIAVMIVLVAIVVMRAGSDVQASNPMQNLVGADWLSTFISNIAFFTIPIVLFWIAITQAEKYSNDMSGLGIKFGSNMGRWMGRKGWHMPISYPLKQTGIAGGMKQAWQDRMAVLGFGKDALASRERKWAARAGGDAARTRLDQENKKLVDEASKKKNMSDLGADELRAIVKNGNKHEKAAALTELAGRGNADRKDLAQLRNIFGADSQVTRSFEAKMRAFDPVAVFTEKIDASTGALLTPVIEGRLKAFVGSNQFDAKKLSSESLTPELLRYAFEAKNISTKDLDELQSRGSNYKKAIQDSLDKAISNISADLSTTGKDWDMDDDVQRNIQMANLAQTGKFHSSVAGTTAVDEAAREKMFKRADADTLKRLDIGELTPKNLELMGKNMGAKYVDVIAKMAESNLATAAQVNAHMKSYSGTDANTLRIKALTSDHRIRHI